MSFDQLYWVSVGACTVGFGAALNRRLAAPGAFVIASALIFLQAFRFWNLTVDDAYISYRYAYNLAHGQGPVFNSGEHVEGYTNFLWVLLLALTEKLGAGIVTPSRWIGYLADVATVGVMYLLARRLVPQSTRMADIAFAGAALVFGALPATGYWATAGLEEPLFTLLALLALYLCIVERDGAQRFPASALVALLAALTRPEGLLVVATIFMVRAVDVVRGRASPRSLAAWCAIIALPYASYVGWRWSYYGYPLPNTYYQKVTGGPTLDWTRYRDGLGYVRSFWLQTGAILIFPLPLFALTRRDGRAALLPLLAFAVLWTAYVVYIGGDFMSFHRFMLPVVPIALLLAAESLVLIFTSIERAHALPARGLVAVAIGAVIVLSLVGVPKREEELLNFRRSGREFATEIAPWLKQQDPETYVAVGAAGYVPFATGLQTLDILGLTDEHIAHGRQLSDSFDFQGHRKGDGAYVLKRRPDIIIVSADPQLFPDTVFAWKTKMGTLAVESDLLVQPDLWDLYQPEWVKLPSGVFNFLKLKDSQSVSAEQSPQISAVEAAELQGKDIVGSCDNWILPRPPLDDEYGYFYLTSWGVVGTTLRRAVTAYRSDVPGSPAKVIELYKQYMAQSRWIPVDTQRGEPEAGAGEGYTIVRFRSGNSPRDRAAFVAVSDDGTSLITSTDFVPVSEPPSALYRCITSG